MKDFEIEFTLTRRTRHRQTVQAETLEEAIRMVEEYEVDNSEAVEVDSYEWSASDVQERKLT